MAQWLVKLVVLLALVVTQTAQVVLPSAQNHAGKLATRSDSIRVDGEVGGDVTSWSGDILIAGRVEGDVVSYTGNVTILPGAQVHGSALALAGSLQVAEQTALEGQPISGGAASRVAASMANAFGSSPHLPAGMANLSRLLATGVVGIMLLGMSIVFLGAWPNRSTTAAITLRRLPGSAVLVGVLATIALALLAAVVGLLLASTILGTPLALVLVLLAHLFCIHGIAVLVQAARQTLQVDSQFQPLVSAALIAAAFVALIGLLGIVAPVLGLIAFYALSAPGLGALLLSRGGMFAPVAAR